MSGIISEFVGKIQKQFSVTKAELNLVSLLLLGLIISLFARDIIKPDAILNEDPLAKSFYLMADSLAEAQKTRFTGAGIGGGFDTLLALADTVPDEDNPYPVSKKKGEIDGKINLNSASKAELMKLPGVGDKTADLIITYRKKTPFRKVEDVKNIKGIGDKKLEKIRPFVVVK